MDTDGLRSEFKKMKYEEQTVKPCDFRLSKGESTKNIPLIDLTGKSSHLPIDNDPSCVEDTSKQPQDITSTKNCGRPSFGFDLNSDDVSVSYNHEPFLPYKNYECVQTRDAFSECGSTCGSMGQKDSMSIWKQMKQNGFLSSSHGGVSVPLIPKPRGRKRGNESVIKKKIEIAKREEVDKFAKVAAPSGLLNGLNPGIINHVRNRKQVHSIIENLVRSTKNKNKSSECMEDINKEPNSDVFTPKLSSGSTIVSENISTLSNEDSANISTVDSLSVKAANVASQWLELLHQDIKGRLAALRHSKKRVRFVTQTELPNLISRELSSSQENDPSVAVSSENNEIHKLRWMALFNQMDKSLSEEEKHLENSLNQVTEMLLHCQHGLLQFPPTNGLQQQANLQNNYIFSNAEPVLDKDLAIRAAAAAIYSTSNFLQRENLPCF